MSRAGNTQDEPRITHQFRKKLPKASGVMSKRIPRIILSKVGTISKNNKCNELRHITFFYVHKFISEVKKKKAY
jgi:hypothetical protein